MPSESKLQTEMTAVDKLSDELAFKAHVSAMSRDYICEPHIGKRQGPLTNTVFHVMDLVLMLLAHFLIQSIGQLLVYLGLSSSSSASR